jgi:hypothetical protein
MMGKRLSGSTATVPQADPTARQSATTAPAAPAHEKVTAMIHPSDSDLTRPTAVRDGQGAPVTCAACGCRLAQTGDAWFHFSPIAGRDARGCRVACADAAHDATGRAVSLAV